MAEIVARYREWFGWSPARSFTIRSSLAALLYRMCDVAGALGWRPPIRTNAARKIARGAVGDPKAWTSVCGIQPQSLAQALAAEPPTIQNKWFSRLYLLKPIVFVSLSAFWIITGVISLTVGYAGGA